MSASDKEHMAPECALCSTNSRALSTASLTSGRLVGFAVCTSMINAA